MPQGLWIAIAVAAALIFIAALAVGLARYRRRRISLSGRDQTVTLDRSGGYTASSGITFSRTETADRIDTTGLPGVGDVQLFGARERPTGLAYVEMIAATAFGAERPSASGW